MGCGASTENALGENTNSSAGEKEISKVSNQPVPPTSVKIETNITKEDKDHQSSGQNDVVDKNSESNSTSQQETDTGTTRVTVLSQGNKGKTEEKKSHPDHPREKVEQSEITATHESMTADQSLGKHDSVNSTDNLKIQSQGNETETKERLMQEEPKDQKKFNLALKASCMLLKQESLLKTLTKSVNKLHLSRALPAHFSLHGLLSKFENLKDLDLSNNNLGPQAFRAVCLSLCSNSTILSLNLAGNRSDTDSAECVGKLITENQTLQYLDISSNYFGKDYFSRQVGQALKINTALKCLRCESIGTTDARVFIEGIQENSSLTELDFSSNEISDSHGFAKGLAESLKKPTCCLCSVALSRCGINSAGLSEIEKGLNLNESLMELNLTGSEFASQGSLVSFIVTAAKHPKLINLSLDSCNIKSQNAKSDATLCERSSSLEVLSLNSCSISDDFFLELTKYAQGKLLSLAEVYLSANEGLSPSCLEHLKTLTTGEESASNIRKLTYGLNKADSIHEKLSCFPSLQYVNLRMCHISSSDVGYIGKLLGSPCCQLSTVILDGLKLSRTAAVKELLETAKNGPLSSLSLGGCSFDDNDLLSLCDSIKAGLQLHMLKLSANRITDVGVAALVEAILKNKSYPLGVLDLSNNRIEDSGAKSLVKLCTNSKLLSLNVSCNSIGKDGLSELVSVVGGKSPLCTLYAQGQTSKLDEGHIIDVFSKLASSLGFKIQRDGDRVKPGCCDLPSNIPEGLLVNLTNLGGNSGDVGQALDCPAIMTDFTQDRLPTLSLAHTMDICSFLKGIGDSPCVWSDLEWSMITGANRPTTDSPSWLKISNQRDLALYLSSLPGNTTQQKIEAILEMEADCNIDEVCLMKDPVTRAINGTGWAVMVDQDSVKKGIDYFLSGEAKVFGQAFMISQLHVKVDDTVNSEIERKAKEDRMVRLKLRQAEDAAHRTLIQNTAEESWKRHAYRLAHPAYADGRIW